MMMMMMMTFYLQMFALSHVRLTCPSAAMSVMSSVMRGTRRLVHADPALFSNFPFPAVFCGAGSADSLLTCQPNRKFKHVSFFLLMMFINDAALRFLRLYK